MDKLEIAIKELLNIYASKLSDFEIATYKRVAPDVSNEEKKLIDWSLSTYVRRNFLAIIVNRTLKNQSIGLCECAKLIGISRNAADSLLRDTEPQGWVKCERNQRGWRYLTASDMVMRVNLKYANRMHERAVDLEMPKATIALWQLKQMRT